MQKVQDGSTMCVSENLADFRTPGRTAARALYRVWTIDELLGDLSGDLRR